MPSFPRTQHHHPCAPGRSTAGVSKVYTTRELSTAGGSAGHCTGVCTLGRSMVSNVPADLPVYKQNPTHAVNRNRCKETREAGARAASAYPSGNPLGNTRIHGLLATKRSASTPFLPKCSHVGNG